MRICLTVTSGPQMGLVLAGDDSDPNSRQSARRHFHLGPLQFIVENRPPWCRLLDQGVKCQLRNVYGREAVDVGQLTDGDLAEAAGVGVRVSIPQAAWVCRTCSRPLSQGTRPPDFLPLCPECALLVGHQSQGVPGYNVVRALGQGAMAITYLALRLADASAVALEAVNVPIGSTSLQVERCRKQVEILRQFDHPNVVAFRDVVEDNGRLYLATEYLPGTDADQYLRKKGALPVNQAAGVVCGVLKGLAHVHARGFVHREVKPANVRLVPERGRTRVVLTDFGDLARSSHQSGLAMDDDIGDTIAFIAPELITHYREAKPTIDQYSAAATLYNLLTGQYIYDLPREIPRQLAMILNEDPIPIVRRRSDVPVKLAEVIHKALVRDPGGRFPDVDAFRRSLLPFARS